MIFFRNRSKLKAISFGKFSDLNTIGVRSFRYCEQLHAFEIPASVEILCEYCFSESGLSRVTFANNSCLKCIEKGSFILCTSLKDIEIPASVDYMAPGCFSGLNVAFLAVAEGNSGYCLGGCLVLSGDRRHLVSVFRCMKDIEIPASVEVLCDECFREYGVSRVTFPSGSCLKRIEKGAFGGCKRLQDIEIPASVEVLCEEWFGPVKYGLGELIACESLSRVTFASGS